MNWKEKITLGLSAVCTVGAWVIFATQEPDSKEFKAGFPLLAASLGFLALSHCFRQPVEQRDFRNMIEMQRLIVREV